MSLLGPTCVLCLFLLFCATYLPVWAAEDEDFVPTFFSGRRNYGQHAGMDPPPPPAIMAARHRGVLPNVTSFYMKQRLDHNNKSSPKSWRQRYLVNDDYFNPNRSRPIIFIRVGGENKISETDLQYGRMVQLAKRHRALLLELEHRYYGESKPTRNLKIENLAFLSHRQALADLERFIHRLKLSYLRNGQRPRVILYGCSYAGSLAAYHRMVYPNSTAGSLSVCSPLTARPENNLYLEGTRDIINAYDSTCWNNAISAIRSVFSTLVKNKTLQTKSLNLCEPKSMDNPSRLEWVSLYYELNSKLMQAIQYNRMNLGSESDIAKLCQFMKNKTIGDVIDRYLAWMQSTGHECLKHDAQTITSRNYRWNATLAISGTRQWLYQMCSEFGYFTGMPNIYELLNLNVLNPNAGEDREIRRICKDSYGIPDADGFSGGPMNNQWNYFPELTKKASRTFFIHGAKDPWSLLGPIQSGFYPSEYSGVSFFEECQKRDVVVKVPLYSSHCEEPTGDANEYPDLVQAYDEANMKITEWVASA